MKASERYKQGLYNEAGWLISADGSVEVRFRSHSSPRWFRFKFKNVNKPLEHVFEDEEVE